MTGPCSSGTVCALTVNEGKSCVYDQRMRFFKLILVSLVLLAIAGAGIMYFLAGREAGPGISIDSPDKFIGRATPVSITIEAATPIAEASFHVDQNGKPATIND